VIIMAFPKPLKVTAQALAGATLTLAAVAVPAHAARQHAASPTTLVFFDSPRGAFARNFNPLTAQPLAPSKAGIYEPLYGSWALLMMLFEREVCTIGVKPRTLVSTYDGVHQLGSQNGRPALYYPDYGIQQRSPATKRGVASCEN